MDVRREKWTGKTLAKTVNTDVSCLNAVRTLHETVVGLRTALDKSKNEIKVLKSKKPTEAIISKYSDAIEKLSLENHILRRKYISTKKDTSVTEHIAEKRDVTSPVEKISHFMANINENKSPDDVEIIPSFSEITGEDVNLKPAGEQCDDAINKPSTVADDEAKQIRDFKQQHFKTDSEESEEVDDIELIFTTDDTKGSINFHGELESICDGDLEEGEHVSKHSVLVETDISKCGIVYNVDNDSNSFLKPSAVFTAKFPSYRPIVIRDRKEVNKISGATTYEKKNPLSSFSNNKTRPILNDKEVLTTSVRDSEAQTDISALPPCWKSESYLAAIKPSSTFTTLPSKFMIPPTRDNNLLRRCSLKLCEKTKEARRILLSDINFTSMVPELSRSVDHLCHKEDVNARQNNNATPVTVLKSSKSPFNLTTGSSRSRFDFEPDASTWDCYDYSSSDRNPSVQDVSVKKSHLSRPSVYSLDAYYSSRTSSVPPSPTQRRHSSSLSYSPSGLVENNFSFPLSGYNNRFLTSRVDIDPLTKRNIYQPQKQKYKVTFKEPQFINTQQSLPNVAINHINEEDSTDSLISESEECIRKSIDTMMSGYDNFIPVWNSSKQHRTFSEPDLNEEFCPPLSARPFVARSPHELLINHFVKAINKDGRVVAGKVQYVGIPPIKSEYYIGVVLPTQVGDSDGTFQGHRFFTCDRNYGIFVPFRKVIMAWKV